MRTKIALPTLLAKGLGVLTVIIVVDCGGPIGPADQVQDDESIVDPVTARRRPDSGVRADSGRRGGRPDSGSGGSSTPDAGTGGGGRAITCSARANFNTRTGGSCGVERWAVKTGSDPAASQIDLTPRPTTIPALTSLRAPASPTGRVGPTETTTFILRNVTLTAIKMEADSDYHMVIQEGGASMIAEVPFPGCVSSSLYSCFTTHPRAQIDARMTVGGGPIRMAMTVTIVGVGFWDKQHGQTGVAPNAVELHPVLAMCFGANCDPFAN